MRRLAVILVNLVAIPIGWLIDRVNLDNLTEDD
jgi:hypothetical protein